MNPVTVNPGTGPVILAQPHGGTWLPDDLLKRLNSRGWELADTDWHIGPLYEGLLEGVTEVQATVHRYAIDVGRDPTGASLYPGQNTTGLCPLTDFDGAPIWHPGEEPDSAEITARLARWHAPYHAALAEQVARVHALHGVAVVYDCHSIRSTIPFLFEGELPVYNIGTDGGWTCAAAIEAAALGHAKASGENWVLNGRFRGGWTTRHYSDRARGVHTIQMEIAQRAYLAAETPPWAFDPSRAAPLRATLRAILNDIDTLARSGALTEEGTT